MHEDDRSTRPVDEPEPQAQRSEVGLATITLRQIRVSRVDVQDQPTTADANPMNRLVPYLDLFVCLTDDELARLAEVPAAVVSDLRRQVVQVDRALARFAELLPRLSDAEMVRLTSATPKTIRFWRLCQPRLPLAGSGTPGWSVALAAEAFGRGQLAVQPGRRPPSGLHSAAPVQSVRRPPSGLHPAVSEGPPLDSGAPLPSRHSTSETTRSGSSPYRMPTAERESGSYRMPTAERESGSSAYRMPTAERESGSYRMATAEREAGPSRRVFDPPGPAASSPRIPLAPVDLSRPRTGRTEENPAMGGSMVPPPPPTSSRPRDPLVRKQQAVKQQMSFSGAPFPGYDSESSGPVGEDDGIFLGLELPDPRTLSPTGRRE